MAFDSLAHSPSCDMQGKHGIESTLCSPSEPAVALPQGLLGPLEARHHGLADPRHGHGVGRRASRAVTRVTGGGGGPAATRVTAGHRACTWGQEDQIEAEGKGG